MFCFPKNLYQTENVKGCLKGIVKDRRMEEGYIFSFYDDLEEEKLVFAAWASEGNR